MQPGFEQLQTAGRIGLIGFTIGIGERKAPPFIFAVFSLDSFFPVRSLIVDFFLLGMVKAPFLAFLMKNRKTKHRWNLNRSLMPANGSTTPGIRRPLPGLPGISHSCNRLVEVEAEERVWANLAGEVCL